MNKEEQLIENIEALLDEATELEREHIKDALRLPPEELAFNELFDGKLRLVIDYKPLDPDSPLGKFYRMWVQMGYEVCLLYTSPSPRDGLLSRMPSSA